MIKIFHRSKDGKEATVYYVGDDTRCDHDFLFQQGTTIKL